MVFIYFYYFLQVRTEHIKYMKQVIWKEKKEQRKIDK